MPNPPELSIIVPACNESGHIPLPVRALTEARIEVSGGLN